MRELAKPRPTQKAARATALILCVVTVCLLVSCAPARAQIIDDGKKQPVIIKPQDAGIHNLQPEVSWYRVEMNKKYHGYITMSVSVAGRTVTFKQTERYKPDKMHYENRDYVFTCEQGTLRPLKVSMTKEGRGYKSYRKIEKDYVFDWENKKIIIISGRDLNAHSRSIPMMADAVYFPRWFFFLRKRELLKPGAKYQFTTFSIDTPGIEERYVTMSALVLAEPKTDVFDILIEMPGSIGTDAQSRFLVEPQTLSNPNGIIARIESFNDFSNNPVTVTKTTEALAKDTATNKNKDQKK